MTLAATFSVATPDEPLERVRACVEALLDRPADRIEPARRGANNRLYRLEVGGKVFAVKQYPALGGDVRDRLGAEFTSLSFLARHGVTDVPAALAVDEVAGIAVFEWVEGQPISRPSPEDIDLALAFAATLRRVGRYRDAAGLPPAAEACPSASELVRQVTTRLAQIRDVAAEHRKLGDFVHSRLSPACAAAEDEARNIYARNRHAFDAELPRERQSLSPSDFGFHNALRRSDGRLVFVDFEYFGWDDPVRLVSDFLLHPGMNLSPDARHRFANGAIAVFDDDENFRWRLRTLFPLVGLRWCLIMLNEFLPERWARRVFAGERDRDMAQERQLQKSCDLLESLARRTAEVSHD